MEKIVVDEEYRKEIDKARSELRARIYKEGRASLMLRLAWNDACTYDPESQIKGGPNGSISSELERSENKGLKDAVQLCGDVKQKTNLKKVSSADLYQLAGVVAVELTGGPTIHFLPGREDHSLEPAQERRIPDPKEKCNAIMELLKKDASLLEAFPADIALVEDKKFRKYVEKYAKDEDAFFNDYAAAHKKFSELGCDLENLNRPPNKLNLKQFMPQVKGVIGIVIASTATLGYYYLRKRKNNQLKK
ncbi:hypothetical protein Fmac_002624 [Flemingia macrophylla]|uniref:Plant heme peroxidase family profile domain-containing protein n=1 Tax=Flemingia macrophylla TaxID=520843 RepID=A0ABD1NKH2_9FABA